MNAKTNPYLTLMIFFNIVFVYGLIALSTNFSLLHHSAFPYYNHLIHSITNGKLFVEHTQYTMDLSFFNNRYYLYWGPAPIVFIAPFYVLGGGVESNDYIYCLFAGLANVVLFHFLLKECLKYFRINIRQSNVYMLWLAFAFTSPNLYCAINGGIWHTSQIIGVFYLLIFLLTFLKYLNGNKSVKYLILSACLFNMAWLSRYGMFLYILFPIYYGLRNDARILKYFLPITVGFILLFMSYNYARFRSPLNIGTNYMVKDTRVIFTREDLAENATLHKADIEGKQYAIGHIQRSFYYLFMNPVRFTDKQPFVITDTMGNGIFFIYPTMLLVFGYFYRRKKLLPNQRQFVYIALSISFIYLASLLLYIGTGYHQVGYRYIFDIVPVFFVISLLWIDKLPRFLPWTLLVYGTILHAIALMAYYGV